MMRMQTTTNKEKERRSKSFWEVLEQTNNKTWKWICKKEIEKGLLLLLHCHYLVYPVNPEMAGC